MAKTEKVENKDQKVEKSTKKISKSTYSKKKKIKKNICEIFGSSKHQMHNWKFEFREA